MTLNELLAEVNETRAAASMLVIRARMLAGLDKADRDNVVGRLRTAEVNLVCAAEDLVLIREARS